MTSLGIGLGSKRLELLRDLIPTATDFALLVNPINPAVADAAARELQAAVAKLSLHLHVLRASTEHEIDVAFAEVSRLHASGVVVAPDSIRRQRSTLIAFRTCQLRP